MERLVDGREQVHRLPSSSGSPLLWLRRRRPRGPAGRAAAACEAESEGAAAVDAVRMGDCVGQDAQ